MPKRAKKADRKAVKHPPPRQVRAPSSFSEDDEEPSKIRALIARVEALEKKREACAAVSGDGLEDSTAPVLKQCSACMPSQAKLILDLSARVVSLEKTAYSSSISASPPIPSEPVSSAGICKDRAQACAFTSATNYPAGGGAGTLCLHTSVALKPWHSRVQEATWSSLPPSTRAEYNRIVHEFYLFRQALDFPNTWPVPPEHLMVFLLHLHDAGKAINSFSTYLAAISFVSKAAGLPDFSSDQRLKMMIKGFFRASHGRPDGHRPITPIILSGLCELFNFLCSSPQEARLFRAACLVLFFGGFHPYEVISRSKFDSSGQALQMKDLSWAPEGIMLHVSKMDQCDRMIYLKWDVGSSLCPVQALSIYLEGQPCVQGPLFQHPDGSPLTLFQFGSILNKAFRALGLSRSEYDLHSFHTGAAALDMSTAAP